MMSMLRWLNDCAPWTDVTFINCARRPEEIIFRKELELLGTRMPGLSLGLLIEERSSRETWSGHTGRIDAARLPLLSPDFHEREVFCCGPEPFMRAVRDMLEAAGFHSKHYHQESFAAPIVEQVPGPLTGATGADSQAEAVPVQFVLSGIEGQCLPGQTVLQSARASGVRICTACESGLCGTCKVKKLSGEVEMNHNGGIVDEEIAAGYFLPCCSKPLSPLQIEA